MLHGFLSSPPPSGDPAGAGLGAALLGWIADQTDIPTVYRLCSFIPLIGLLTALLPNLPDSKSK